MTWVVSPMNARASNWFKDERLRVRFAAIDRSELEQAVLRVVLIGVVYLYVLWSVYADGTIDPNDHEIVVAGAGFLSFGVGLLLHIVFSRRPCTWRRYLGMFADNAATTYCLIHMGEGGAFVLGVYLFVTFGNGFRFGRRYLHACQAMAIVGFALVLLISPFWSRHQVVGMGLVTALIVLPLYVGVLSQRITEAKCRADEASKAKSRFLANMSHEMRTPLNGVIALADVLRETKLSESQREIVETMTTSANLLLAQIEDVLNVAKIEAGRVAIESRPFDLRLLLTSTVKIILPQARYKGLAVVTELDDTAPAWFAGDPHHIGQVLLNLLSNAVKFTDKGQITVRASTIERAPKLSLLRVEVIDTGIGIVHAKQEKIFEAFSQADDSITRVYGGTGLGTTIAKQLVSLMGGTIGLESAVGVGSNFWFELPLRQAQPVGLDLTSCPDALPAIPFAAKTPSTPASIYKIRGARILVAEDNPTNQRVAQLILESGGHHITIAKNGEEALDALETSHFDLALFDLSMPLVSGLEALKLYRFSTSRPIPVLILSAHVTPETILECERAGASEFISKPLRASILLDAIERHLAGTEIGFGSQQNIPRADERPPLAVVETPTLDESVLLDLRRLSPDSTFIERLIDGFLADTERLTAEIVNALAHRRYELVKDVAHALKGGAASVGAMSLAQVATRLNKASNDTLRFKATAWSEEVLRASAVTQNALKAYTAAYRATNSRTSKPSPS